MTQNSPDTCLLSCKHNNRPAACRLGPAQQTQHSTAGPTLHAQRSVARPAHSPASTWCCCRPTMRIASNVCLLVGGRADGGCSWGATPEGSSSRRLGGLPIRPCCQPGMHCGAPTRTPGFICIAQLVRPPTATPFCQPLARIWTSKTRLSSPPELLGVVHIAQLVHSRLAQVAEGGRVAQPAGRGRADGGESGGRPCCDMGAVHQECAQLARCPASAVAGIYGECGGLLSSCSFVGSGFPRKAKGCLALTQAPGAAPRWRRRTAVRRREGQGLAGQ